MLITDIAGVKAVGVERLNALLVGVTRVDHCLTEERGLNRSFSYLSVFDPTRRTCVVRRDNAKVEGRVNDQKFQIKRGFCLLRTIFTNTKVASYSPEPVGNNAHLLFVEGQGHAAPVEHHVQSGWDTASPRRIIVYSIAIRNAFV